MSRRLASIVPSLQHGISGWLVRWTEGDREPRTHLSHWFEDVDEARVVWAAMCRGDAFEVAVRRGREEPGVRDEALINALVDREGGYRDVATDHGGPTNFGITARVLGEWRKLGRQATRAEVRALQRDEAKAIYRAIYLEPFAWVPDAALRAQLVDFAVNSGVRQAVCTLQQVLGVDVDGVAGAQTQRTCLLEDARFLNNGLVGARVRFLEGIVDHDPTQMGEFHGWVRRAVGFFA